MKTTACQILLRNALQTLGMLFFEKMTPDYNVNNTCINIFFFKELVSNGNATTVCNLTHFVYKACFITNNVHIYLNCFVELLRCKYVLLQCIVIFMFAHW